MRNSDPALQSGELVVAGDPGIAIRSTCDFMGCATWIKSATCDASGTIVAIDFADQFKDFPDSTMTLTKDGLTLYEDESGTTYTADELALLQPDGTLIPLKAERGKPVFVGDVEWAKRLIVAAEAALAGVAEGDLHNNLFNAINEAVQAVWGVVAPPASERNITTHRFEVRSKATKGNIGWFPVERYGREAARAHAIALLTQMGNAFELVERARPDIEPGEFWRCREAGYTVITHVGAVMLGGAEAIHYKALGPGDVGELIKAQCFATEREAWQACDRHRMFGSAAPLDD